jgi:hypothetical protein
MTETTEAFDGAKSRRRWFQFTLRTLLVAVLVLSLPLSWVAMKRHRERRAVAEIRRLSGGVVYDYDYASSDWWGSARMPHFLREFFFSGVYQIGFDPQTIDDDALRHVGVLTDVRVLALAGNQITDSGMEHLSHLTELQYLGLADTRVGDAGLEHLKGLASLGTLQLGRTQVTDAGLAHLKGLVSLYNLDLEGTQVSAEGVRKLQQALPNCRIDY